MPSKSYEYFINHFQVTYPEYVPPIYRNLRNILVFLAIVFKNFQVTMICESIKEELVLGKWLYLMQIAFYGQKLFQPT